MTQEEFNKLQIGTVIIDDNGYDYIISECLVIPSNPADTWSIIRRHKFNPEGFRVATPEETEKFFETLKTNGYVWNADTEMTERIPKEHGQTADEAAEELFETIELNEHENIFEDTFKKIFKAGIKWAFEQGVICEGKVFSSTCTSYVKTPGIEEMLNKEFPQDTDVIVQVRRK